MADTAGMPFTPRFGAADDVAGCVASHGTYGAAGSDENHAKHQLPSFLVALNRSK